MWAFGWTKFKRAFEYRKKNHKWNKYMDVPLGHYILVHMSRLIIGPKKISDREKKIMMEICNSAVRLKVMPSQIVHQRQCCKQSLSIVNAFDSKNDASHHNIHSIALFYSQNCKSTFFICVFFLWWFENLQNFCCLHIFHWKRIWQTYANVNVSLLKTISMNWTKKSLGIYK